MLIFNLKVLTINAAFLIMQGCGGNAVKATAAGDLKMDTKKKEVVVASDVVTGVMTDKGVMCPAMMGDDGELYTFATFPDGIVTGDRLSVKKSEAGVFGASNCDQGLALSWTSITRLQSEDKPEKTWNKE